MELRQYLSVIRRWWWFLVIMAIAGGGVALATTFLGQPTYESSTTILINQAPGSLPSADAVLSGQRVASTYAELIHQRPVLEQVIDNLGLNEDAEELDKQISVTPVRDTNLLVVSVRDSDPERGGLIANEIVKVFIDQNLKSQASRYADQMEGLQTEMAAVQADINRTEASIRALEGSTQPEEIAQSAQLQNTLTQQRTNYSTLLVQFNQVQLAQTQTSDKVTVVEDALPGKPTQSIAVVAVLGIFIGILTGFGGALVIEALRSSIHTIEELEDITGVPTLGLIARVPSRKKIKGLITILEPRSPISEAYRVLHANIEFASADHPINKLVISSSNPGEGKSTVAANLAVAMARSGKRVLLVDADLRRPYLHRLFRRENSRGLTTTLSIENGRNIVENIVSTEMENLSLMPSGPLPHNPSELLGSQRMSELIAVLARHWNIVIFDTPPILALADTTLLMRQCDAVVLVVESGVTRADTLARTRNQITQSGASITGTVLNKLSSSSDGYYHYYYQNSDGTEKRR